MIALVDYGAGNLTSVQQALAALGAEVATAHEPQALAGAAGIVVPGVGHFDRTRALDAGWRAAINDAIRGGTPVLGICLGLQWLFEGSDEAPGLPGLGVFAGTCRLLPRSEATSAELPRLKVPHVGWNTLATVGGGSLLEGIADGTSVYFTHSYAAPIVAETTAVTVHGESFTAAVERGRVAGVQFHPETSGDAGLRVLGNWLDRVSGTARRPRTAAAASDTLRDSSSTGRRTGLSKRLIACLDVRDGAVVKGINFEGLRDAGDPELLAARYDAEGIDEVVVLDVTATLQSRRARARTIADIARVLSLPLAAGGGIRTEADAAAAIEAGADKVCVNTAALERPAIVGELAARYGSQAVIVAIDAKRDGSHSDDSLGGDGGSRSGAGSNGGGTSSGRGSSGGREGGGGGWTVYSRSGQTATPRALVAWAEEAAERGAGEILLTSIDRDGTRSGFDCAMTAAVAGRVPIPVIASGGAGRFEHFAEVLRDGHADAALAASVFHFQDHSVADLKRYLVERGIPMRRR